MTKNYVSNGSNAECKDLTLLPLLLIYLFTHLLIAFTHNKGMAEESKVDLTPIHRDTIIELIDPDYGLELRSEVEEALKMSLESNERIPIEKVAKELGLKW